MLGVMATAHRRATGGTSPARKMASLAHVGYRPPSTARYGRECHSGGPPLPLRGPPNDGPLLILSLSSFAVNGRCAGVVRNLIGNDGSINNDYIATMP